MPHVSGHDIGRCITDLVGAIATEGPSTAVAKRAVEYCQGQQLGMHRTRARPSMAKRRVPRVAVCWGGIALRDSHLVSPRVAVAARRYGLQKMEGDAGRSLGWVLRALADATALQRVAVNIPDTVLFEVRRLAEDLRRSATRPPSVPRRSGTLAARRSTAGLRRAHFLSACRTATEARCVQHALSARLKRARRSQ